MNEHAPPDLCSRACGSLLGLAVGDALGTTLEFRQPGSFVPLTDMVGGGPFRLERGQWTDDTSMALCLAESLLECNGFDAADQLRRYVRWYREGYFSSTGHCFDIGNTVRSALERFERTGDPASGSTAPSSAGNGSLMRLAPIPLFYFYNPLEAIERAGQSSLTTHGAAEAVDACRYFAGLMVGALQGRPREELLAQLFNPVEGRWADAELSPAIGDIARGSFLRREPPEIRGAGYVVPSLEAALWVFGKSTAFEDGALLAVNLGNDSDTTGAIYGQLAGAFYGVESIPERWLQLLTHRQMIEDFAVRLLEAVRQKGQEKCDEHSDS